VGTQDPTGLLDVAQLSLAIELVQDAVAVYDDQARIVLVNDRLLAATGYARSDLVGHPALTLLPAALREELTPRMLAYAGDPVARRLGDGLASRIQCKDGSTFEAQIANSPTTAASGTLIMVTIRVAGSLSLEEIQFRGLLEGNPDATLICSPEGKVVLSNTSAQRLFGREHIEMFNQPLASLFPASSASALAMQMEHALECPASRPAATDSSGFDVDVVRRDDSVVPVEVSISEMPLDLGSTLRVVVRDIRERRRAQREAEAIKDGFLATVSHELRTPLTSVLGYGELLEDLGRDDLSDHARSLLDVVIRNARRELRLVDDLLVMVRIGDGAFRIQPSRINLSELVQDSVEAATPVARRSRVVLSLDAAGEDSFVLGDADRLGQAIDNLLTNSLKFSPEAGLVTVGLTADAETVRVAVTNPGGGIQGADVEHVFDRLFRGDNAVRGKKQGVGLGLSIVRAIIEAHGGEVSASCTATTTCFTIMLPLAG
jgi:PAS domain S-box-containing protein